MQVNMLEAKTQLSRLVEAALNGEEVVIANRGKPVVRLVGIEPVVKRKGGSLAGRLTEAEIEAAFSPQAKREWNAVFEREFPTSPARPVKRVAKARSLATSRKT
jgi:prevent-host-death family protein